MNVLQGAGFIYYSLLSVGMKKELSGFELHHILREMDIVGGKVDQVYQTSKDEFFFRFFVSGRGKIVLRIDLPSLIYMTTKRKESPQHPKGFCMLLRKRLANARITAVEQLNMERIVRFTFETRDEIYIVIAELFSKGNIILCDKEETIIMPVFTQKLKDRTIKKGERYVPPPLKPSVHQLEDDDIRAMMQASARSLVKFLATELGLGGTLSEEICLRAGLDKKASPKDIDPGSLIHELRSIMHEASSPAIVKKEGKVLDVIPISMQLYQDCELESYESFNDALDTLLASDFVTESPAEKRYRQKKEKLQRIIDLQKQDIENLKAEIDENQAKADAIYSDYQDIDKLLKTIGELKEKHTWKELKEMLESYPYIKQVDLKHKKIVIER